LHGLCLAGRVRRGVGGGILGTRAREVCRGRLVLGVAGIEVSCLVVAVMNRKGGSGKTTTAFYLATCAVREGREAVVVDAVNERSALAWAHLSGGLPFEVVLAEEDNLPSQVVALRDAGKTVFVDGPPNNKEYVLSAAPVADRILIPMTPEPADMNRLLPILKQLHNVEVSLQRPFDRTPFS